ncbi:MAG: GrdX protein [Firmicutes bacterium]|nr:GrdX protein [Bacillota bacterium]
MRQKVIVITNNKTVELKEHDQFIPGSHLEVLKRCRDLIHQGHILISHPLSGGVKPNEIPCKSVVLSRQQKEEPNWQSLYLIERSLDLAEEMALQAPPPAYPERLLADFRSIDYDLLQNVLESLPNTLR